jgi:large subunit ribosomal protein L3
MEDKKRSILMVGKKVGMTQLYCDSGVLSPVTVVEMCDAEVSRVKTVDSDGYEAVQVGFKKNGSDKGNLFKELRVEDVAQYGVGSRISAEEFCAGDSVDVIGKTKGKGFQGVMKRHGFSGGPAAHGSMFHRRGGSYGQRQWPGHVFRGRKMPGHDGCVRCTVQNLEVVGVRDSRFLIIKGSIPGSNGSYVTVRHAKKAKGVK